MLVSLVLHSSLLIKLLNRAKSPCKCDDLGIKIQPQGTLLAPATHAHYLSQLLWCTVPSRPLPVGHIPSQIMLEFNPSCRPGDQARNCRGSPWGVTCCLVREKPLQHLERGEVPALTRESKSCKPCEFRESAEPISAESSTQASLTYSPGPQIFSVGVPTLVHQTCLGWACKHFWISVTQLSSPQRLLSCVYSS